MCKANLREYNCMTIAFQTVNYEISLLFTYLNPTQHGLFGAAHGWRNTLQ